MCVLSACVDSPGQKYGMINNTLATQWTRDFSTHRWSSHLAVQRNIATPTNSRHQKWLKFHNKAARSLTHNSRVSIYCTWKFIPFRSMRSFSVLLLHFRDFSFSFTAIFCRITIQFLLVLLRLLYARDSFIWNESDVNALREERKYVNRALNIKNSSFHRLLSRSTFAFWQTQSYEMKVENLKEIF